LFISKSKLNIFALTPTLLVRPILTRSTRHVILDESDRLLSDDFRPQILPILSAASNPAVQKCFLSATMPSGSEAIAKKWLRDGGVRVVVGLK
jgi:ATP-dependent RNA helicase DDX52/ROK1